MSPPLSRVSVLPHLHSNRGLRLEVGYGTRDRSEGLLVGGRPSGFEVSRRTFPKKWATDVGWKGRSRGLVGDETRVIEKKGVN